MSRRTFFQRRLRDPVLALLAIGALSACSGGVGATGDEGEGLPQDASKEEWVQAFEDVEPITLRMTDSSAEAFYARAYEEYGAVLEEWSGGKIDVQVDWGFSVVDQPEVDDALADGRLDMAMPYPLYSPQEYPTNNALVSLTHHRPESPVVGGLAAWGAMSSAARQSEELREEYERKGIFAVDPFYARAAASYGVACREPIDSAPDLQGRQVRSGAVDHDAQLRAMGATPVSLSFGETYEGLQRGTIDCTVGSLSAMSSGGWVEVAPHIVLPEDASFSLAPQALAWGANIEGLPLVAQQLIFDKQVEFLRWMILDDWNGVQSVHEQVEEYGGTWTTLDAESEQRLLEANERIDADIAANDAVGGSGLVNDVSEANEEWESRVEDLGYEDEADWEDFGAWYEGHEHIDLDPFLDAYYETNLLPARPE